MRKVEQVPAPFRSCDGESDYKFCGYEINKKESLIDEIMLRNSGRLSIGTVAALCW